MEIVKLKFTSPLHLSRGKSTLDESFDVLHADTLKAALFVCALELYDTQIVIFGNKGKGFFESFTISSAFPFVNDELFFPKPEWLPDGLMKNIDRKKGKKVKYIGQNVFEQILKDGAKAADDKLVLDEVNIKNIRYYTEKTIEPYQPYESQTVQRVTVNRTFEEEGNTFYTERLYFTKGCGLFFLIEFTDATMRPIVEAALRLLGDNGIGSDKSVGNGQFQFNGFAPFTFDKAQNADKQIALSLYCPNTKSECTYDKIKDKTFLEGSAYSLIKRGGYIANPDDFRRSTLRKRSIVMFTEGSVFPNDRKLVGDVKNLNPESEELREKDMVVEHPIHRDGRAMFFPYNLKLDKQKDE